MKKGFFIFLLLLLTCLSYAGHYDYGRYDRSQPDLGLPEGNYVFIGLIVGVVSIAIGQILVREKDDEILSRIGGILHWVGFIGLIPLLIWICAIGQAILSVAIVIGIVIFIIALMFSKK